jgi:DNA topoisomerase-1
VHFRFRGKSGKEHIIDVHNAKLAKIVGKCQALPGQELFQYVDSDGELQAVDSSDVNDYVRQITGQDFTAKDFRTWAGTVLALRALRETESYRSATQAKKNVVAAIKAVAEKLGNTPSVCRKCYVHPAVIEAYMNGYFAGAHAPADPPQASSTVDLPEEEAALMALLEQAASRAHGQVPSKRAQRPAA